ncbi:hypothetical protein BKI52_23895 [marine bacterium AO1-C]|nr:hypothetical protein BKI52_23895 [marine bacterium AO1-C]
MPQNASTDHVDEQKSSTPSKVNKSKQSQKQQHRYLHSDSTRSSQDSIDAPYDDSQSPYKSKQTPHKARQTIYKSKQIPHKAKQMPYKAKHQPISKTSSQVLQLQTQPEVFDVLELMENPTLKGLGMEALLALLHKHKQEIGANLVDKMLHLTLAALDPIMKAAVEATKNALSGAFDKLPVQVKNGARGLWELGKFIKNLHDAHPILVVVSKYALGRGLFYLSESIGYPVSHGFLNTAMNLDTKVADLVGWVSGISERLIDFIDKYMPGVKAKLTDNEEFLNTLADKPASAGFNLLWEYGISAQVGAQNQSFGTWVMSASGNADLMASAAIGGGLALATIGSGSLWLFSKVAPMDSSYAKTALGVGALLAAGGLAAKSAYHWYYGSGQKNKELDSSITQSEQQQPKSKEDGQESKPKPEKDKEKALPGLDTKFFWLYLNNAEITEWDKGTKDEQGKDEKTGGALLDFGMGFRLFGYDLLASDQHQLKLDWGGGFDYQNANIDIIANQKQGGEGIGFKDIFTFEKASITNIHINSEDGLKSLGMKLTALKIGPGVDGVVSTENVSVEWSKEKGFDFTIESAALHIQGQDIANGSIHFGLNDDGSFREGDFSVQSDQTIEVLPGTLGVKLAKIALGIDENKKLSGTFQAGVDLTTQHVDLHTGLVTIEYNEGWIFDAPDIQALVRLPGDAKVDAKASIHYESATQALQGALNASLSNLTIIENVLLLKQLTLGGSIDTSEKNWNFAASGAGTVTIPGGEELNIEAALRLAKGMYDGQFSAKLPGRVEAIPEVLALKNLGFEGYINNDDWGMKIWGGADLTSQFFSLDAQKLYFTYTKSKGWELGAQKLGLFLNILNKQFQGEANFKIANRKFSGDLTIGTSEIFELIPGVLFIKGGEFQGEISEDKKLHARLTTSLAGGENSKYFTLEASKAYIDYDQRKGESFAQAWNIGIEEFKAGIWNNRVSLTFQDVNFSFADKKLELKKITLAYKHGGKKDGELPSETDFSSLANIIQILKEFEVEASLENITIDENGFHLKNKKPNWSLREFEVEYMGFGVKMTINEEKVEGRLKGKYSTTLHPLNLEADVVIPPTPIAVVAGLNLRVKAGISADVGLVYNRERSKQSGDGHYYLTVDGGVHLDGGVYLEGVLGASIGAGQLASIGGQLYGAAGVDIAANARAGATLFYDSNQKKLSQGPNPEDKLNLHVDAGFTPTIELGGRLVLKLLNQKFNLFQYTFAKWQFGNAAFVFDIRPDEDGVYRVVIDKKKSHINGKSLEDRSLKGLLSQQVEGIDHTALEDYDALRDVFSEAERALSKGDKELAQQRIDQLDTDVGQVEQSLIELLANLEVKKAELKEDLAIQKAKEEDEFGFFKRHFGDVPSDKIEDSLKNSDEAITKLEHEIPKVMLLNRDSVAAVDLLKERRDQWWHVFSHKRFGIWEDLYEEIAREKAARGNKEVNDKLVKQEIEALREQLKVEIATRTQIMIQKIKDAPQGARNRVGPSDD